MYVLHFVPDTASLVVRIVLEELGQPYRAHLVNRDLGEQNSPAYRRLQPLGLIPALETPDGPMFETGAMLLWLADRHGALAPAPTAPARVAFLKWFIFTNNAVHTTLLNLFYPERMANEAAVPAVLAAAHDRMQTYLALLNDMVRSDQPDWLSPDHPSIMGHYIGMLLRWLRIYGPGHPAHFDSTDFPALHAVIAAHETRPAALIVARAEGLGPALYTNPTYES